MHPVYTLDRTSRAICDLIPYQGVGGSGHMVTRIHVPAQYQGRGYGSRLLDLVCAAADREGARLLLYPVPSGPLSKRDLVRWYESRGWVMKKGIRPRIWVREPRAICPH